MITYPDNFCLYQTTTDKSAFVRYYYLRWLQENYSMLLLYILYHDNDSEKIADDLIHGEQEIITKKIKLKPDRYFESQFFNQSDSMEIYDRWETYDYVGIITYGYAFKTKSKLSDIKKCYLRNEDCDVIALHDSDQNLLSQAAHVHGPLFLQIWKDLLIGSKFEEDCLREDLPAFYCNFWLARPSWFKRYKSFAKSIMNAAETDQKLSANLMEDPKYRGRLTDRALIEISGKRHYTFHPFIMERMPGLFFYLSGAKIGRRNKPESSWKIWRPFPAHDVNTSLPTSPNKIRLALFATHSNSDEISRNNIRYISELCHNFDFVVVMTTQPNISFAKPVSFPKNLRIFHAENSCHDFGLHFRFLYFLDMQRISEIGMFNDSCWILRPLADTLKSARDMQSNVVGLTDSRQISYHLQSFFMLFKDSALSLLQQFVHNSKMHPLLMKTKNHVIMTFEIGLSKFLLMNRLDLSAVYNCDRVNQTVSKLNSNGVNMSYHCWDKLLSIGCPLLKKARKTYEDEYNFIQDYTEF